MEIRPTALSLRTQHCRKPCRAQAVCALCAKRWPLCDVVYTAVRIVSLPGRLNLKRLFFQGSKTAS
jgi:hypothetical protein